MYDTSSTLLFCRNRHRFKLVSKEDYFKCFRQDFPFFAEIKPASLKCIFSIEEDQ